MFKIFQLHLLAQSLPEDHDALCTFSRISRTLLSRLHQSASQKPKGVFCIGSLTEEPCPSRLGAGNHNWVLSYYFTWFCQEASYFLKIRPLLSSSELNLYFPKKNISPSSDWVESQVGGQPLPCFAPVIEIITYYSLRWEIINGNILIVTVWFLWPNMNVRGFVMNQPQPSSFLCAFLPARSSCSTAFWIKS